MGALVLTKGSRHLISHFNTEFKGNRLKNLRSDPIEGTSTLIKDVFANGNVDLLWLTNNVQHPHSQRTRDHKCLLPDDNSTGQAHLEVRWLYFLTSGNTNVLTATNHQIIRQAISTVLHDTSYGHIEFDCIDCPTQTVFYADEYDNSGANPVKYMRIVLGTPPMDKLSGTNLSLDQQGGYTGSPPTLVFADGKSDGDGDESGDVVDGG
ncbi:hypothetical protein L6654_41255 [Bradyrhizobium sp. WYCCWR 13023]|uniref:Uncharacterized protein n=1 Tax=Bradyrhizobium zhengyangense TaxID=2911009 RepID=A0A9X1RLU1_9BRAD|nr:hypothetical protein [Bradyrhizobium zhengyangense]MCG2632994.1 hypothetical protein [Bradyrhizobium zhengyangense]